MALIKVNPTRMELRRLKARLKTAVRGHKLLKDKSDEMIRQFIIYARENKRLREEVEKELVFALGGFMLSMSVSDSYIIEEAVAMSGTELEIETGTSSIMSVSVPKISIKDSNSTDKYPYSFTSVTSELDGSISTLSQLMNKMVKLAEVEKTCNMLADEIEKNKRRVNALEYVMIPDTEETIKYITMKLDENDRGTITRLMKFKSIMEKRNNQE